MRKYVVALFCDLCDHSDAWNRIPEDKMAGLVGEYWALARKVADQHGSFHSNFTGDGHLFLFEDADAAVRFGLRVIRAWRDGFGTTPALQGLEPIPLRVGAHFGKDTEIGNGEAWVGRANNVAKRIEAAAEPDSLFVSEGMLDLIDFPRYHVQPVAPCELKGDCVASRTLYRVVQFDEAASAAKPPDELTAEDWFLRAVAMIGTAKEGGDQEEACYVEALRLRPDYAEAHNNYGALLTERDDIEGAEEHYLEALRLRPDHHEVHYNYANALKEKDDLEGAEEHYLEALRLRPDNHEAHNNYANLLQARRDVKRADVKHAEEHYVEALRLRPDDPEAHNNYASLLQARRDVKRADVKHAEEHYVEALRLRPDYAEAHNNYGALLTERDDVEGADVKHAEEHYLEALRLRPDYAIAHHNYATLLQKKGDVNGAEEHYRKAYELDPAHSQIKAAFERRAWEP